MGGGGGGPAPTIYATHDFNDGTIGPFSSFGSISFPDDPSGLLTGKVAQIAYSVGGSGGSDDDTLWWAHSPDIRYGQEFWCKGDVVMPSGAGDSNNRKLLDWQGLKVRMTLNAQGTDLRYSFVDASGDGSTEVEVAFGSTGIVLLKDTKYTIEVRTITNTAGNDDGQVQVWVNNPGATPDWDFNVDAPAQGVEWIHEGSGGTYFRNLLFGKQLSAPGAFSENRWWDNVTFSDLRT